MPAGFADLHENKQGTSQARAESEVGSSNVESSMKKATREGGLISSIRRDYFFGVVGVVGFGAAGVFERGAALVAGRDGVAGAATPEDAL